MMRICVTGGAGWIGSCLIDRLIEEGHETVSYDLKPSKTRESIVGNILNKGKLLEAVKTCDHVFHLAAVADLNYARKNPHETVKINVKGTHNVAEACATHGVSLSFASTCCIYGNSDDHPSNEESLCVPTEIYAVTKLAGEQIIKQLHEKRGLSYNILRFGTTYGLGMRGQLAIYIFILQGITDTPITIDGSGQQTRCYIYIDDLIEATIRSMKLQATSETLNLTTEEEVSVLDTATLILEELGKPEALKELRYMPERPGQIMKEQIDISKALKLLDWTPKIDFREGLKRTVKWFKEQPN